MDEERLNDLLECSVCLERLDSTSKVLPCQHTFCKRCLEEILCSRKELRCPECRILVEVAINDLPNNFLLIRLLEGIKNAPRSNRANGSEDDDSSLQTTTSSSSQTSGNNSGQSKCSPVITSGKKVDGQDTKTPKQITKPQPCARAMYSYEAKEPGDLSFKKGDIVLLKKRIDQNWYHGELGNKHGFFPVTYVHVMTPLHLPQAKALYDFSLNERDEKDCLTFKKGELITVIRRVDENWVEGQISDKIGIFPITFVEMNSAARALVKLANGVPRGPVRDVPLAPQPVSKPPVVSSSMSSQTITTSSNNITIIASPSSVALDATGSNPPSEVNPNCSAQTSRQGNPFNAASSVNKRTQVSSSSIIPENSMISQSVIPQPLPQPPSHPKNLIYRQQREKRHSVASIVTGTLTSCTTSSPRQVNSRHSMDAGRLLAPITIPSHIARSRAVTKPVDKSTSTNAGVSKTAAVTSVSTSRVNSSMSSKPEQPVIEVKNGDALLVRRHSFRREKGNASNQQLHSHSRQHSAPDPTTIPPHISTSNTHAIHAQIPNFYVAMYSYKPQKEDELELKKGELYTVSEKCLDGWFKGTSLKLSQTGVFPGNYVQLAKHSAKLPSALQPNAKVSAQSSSTQTSNKSNAVTQVTYVNIEPSSALTTKASSMPPPRPPQPQHILSKTTNVSSSSTGTSTTSPWIAKTDCHTLNVQSSSQQQNVNVALPLQHAKLLTTSAMSSSIPIPVQTALLGQPTSSSSGVASQSWHGVVSSSSGQPQVSLMSAASSITPPNVTVLSGPSNPTPGKPDKQPKDKKEREKVSSVLKRLTGVKRKSKSPPPPSMNFSMDNPNFVENTGRGTPVQHVRSDSCPNETTVIYSVANQKVTSGIETSDANSCNISTSRPKQPAPLIRERFRCIVPYPPNSDYELELKVGDVIYVHKKREDGWYKGTLHRTGKTGLFPGSFVESF